MSRNVAIRIFIVLALLLTFATAAAASEGPHWSYDGDTGPAFWGVLAEDYALCGTGQSQSPVDIPSSAPSNPADLGMAYQPSAVNIFNNGHTIQVNYDPGSNLTVDGSEYQLLQYHFHAASEHTVDGSQRPMEIHFVHQNAQGKLAVVGTFLVDGAANAAYTPIFDNLPASESEPEAVPGAQVNAIDLMPGQKTYWRYSGSLTTPPCSEGVTWLVMNNPVEVSSEQIGAYTAIYDHNFRPTQAMNSREFIVGQAPTTLPTTGGVLGDSSAVVWLIPLATLVLVVILISLTVRKRTA
ncbi:MAG: carbonic anhydrase family protein [Caldilineales bacterium]|nr:carbonic anhydrase family protein [Caldilineales bacterium]